MLNSGVGPRILLNPLSSFLSCLWGIIMRDITLTVELIWGFHNTLEIL